MARYIDLDDDEIIYCGNDGEYERYNIPTDVPTADVVEIVRCKDCVYYLNSSEKCDLIDTRLHFYETANTWTGDCFCYWGERRVKDG